MRLSHLSPLGSCATSERSAIARTLARVAIGINSLRHEQDFQAELCFDMSNLPSTRTDEARKRPIFPRELFCRRQLC